MRAFYWLTSTVAFVASVWCYIIDGDASAGVQLALLSLAAGNAAEIEDLKKRSKE